MKVYGASDTAAVGGVWVYCYMTHADKLAFSISMRTHLSSTSLQVATITPLSNSATWSYAHKKAFLRTLL